MITTVLFDMGGTLEDISVDDASRHSAAEKTLAILRAHGMETGESVESAMVKLESGWDRYYEYRTPIMRELKPDEIWPGYLLTEFSLDVETIKPFAEELALAWEITHYHRTLRPHVAEMLAGLKSLGLKLGVVSNTASLFQVFASLENYGIRNYFQDVTLSSVTGYRKPHETIFQVALHQVQSDPAVCAYVGDTFSRDVLGAQNAGFGMTFHIRSFLTKSRDVDVPKDARATYVVEDMYEVYTTLRDLMKSE